MNSSTKVCPWSAGACPISCVDLGNLPIDSLRSCIDFEAVVRCNEIGVDTAGTTVEPSNLRG